MPPQIVDSGVDRSPRNDRGHTDMATPTNPVTVVDAGEGKVSRSVNVGTNTAELFAMVADPRRHSELDGSGTVTANVSGPAELAAGSKFSTKMKMFGLPYRITSTVTRFEPGRVIEWRHPLGHRWRWEFEQVDAGRTRITETFDYGNRKWFYEAMGFVKGNTTGIEATLSQLRDRYPVE
jgi:YD repeat-containing protein